MAVASVVVVVELVAFESEVVANRNNPIWENIVFGLVYEGV